MKAYHFWSPDCKPCMRLKNEFEILEQDFPQYEWHHINIKDDPEGFTAKYGVTTIPALFLDTPQGIKSYSGINQITYYRILRDSLISK